MMEQEMNTSLRCRHLDLLHLYLVQPWTVHPRLFPSQVDATSMEILTTLCSLHAFPPPPPPPQHLSGQRFLLREMALCFLPV